MLSWLALALVLLCAACSAPALEPAGGTFDAVPERATEAMVLPPGSAWGYVADPVRLDFTDAPDGLGASVISYTNEDLQLGWVPIPPGDHWARLRVGDRKPDPNDWSLVYR